MKDRLAKLEARIERLIEGAFSRLFAGRLQPREVAIQLSRVMEDHAAPGPNEQRLAPTSYSIAMHPADLEALKQALPDLDARLAVELVEFARELGLVLPARPIITMVAKDDVKPHGIAVEVENDSEATSHTRQLAPERRPPTRGSVQPNAYLILEDGRHVPLDGPVVNLGRQLDNHIVLDYSHVSRHHAQLRQRYGRWVVYDLGSSGGTGVNYHPIQECILRPGDVITLAGVSLIYTEDETDATTGFEDTGHTRPLSQDPSSGNSARPS